MASLKSFTLEGGAIQQFNGKARLHLLYIRARCAHNISPIRSNLVPDQIFRAREKFGVWAMGTRLAQYTQ